MGEEANTSPTNIQGHNGLWKQSFLTSCEMHQSIQQMTSKAVYSQCQNQQQQHEQMPCLALSAMLIYVSLGLSEDEL